MARLSRGLALMLVVFGGIFAGLGQWLCVSRGPATTSFEGVRRFAAALDAQDLPLAASLGRKSIALVSADKRWGAAERAELDYHMATTSASIGQKADALKFARMASGEIASAPEANLDLAVNVAQLHGDLALGVGNKLEAACTYGLLLERVGPDRVAYPEERLRPHPTLEALTDHLISLGKAFAAATASTPATAEKTNAPLTSCNLAAGFYAARKDYTAAASISDAVLKRSANDKKMGPEIRAALLQDASHIAELNGQIDLAKARAAAAVNVLSGDGLEAPRAVALERLAMLHTNWSDAKGAEPYLQEAIYLKQKIDGTDSPDLISPLLTLGYARLDNKDAESAESLFKRALSIAEVQPKKDSSASLEATLALAELYDDENRSSEAAEMHSKAADLQQAGVALHAADVEDLPLVEPAAKKRLALINIGYASDKQSGQIEVALNAPNADWVGAWPLSTFTPASESFASPMVYAPRMDRAGKVGEDGTPNILFVPGQGTNLSGNAARLARLRAFMGPGAKPLLIAWTDGDAVTEGLRSGRAEAAGVHSIAAALSRDARAHSMPPLTIIAEGRGAFVALSALAELPPAQRAKIDNRLQNLILIAPDIDAALFTQALAHIDRSRTRTIVYAEIMARPLRVSNMIYGARPIGLDPKQISQFKGVETIEIKGSGGWAGFGALWSEALIGDIARVVNRATPAGSRCGVAPDGARTANLYALDPQGCTLAITN